jgi:two-component sensor histidine kinase
MDDAAHLSAETADFLAVFRSAPTPLLLIAADPPRFTMVCVNEAHARAFGTTGRELEGFGVFEVFPEDATPVSAAFAAAVRGSLEQVMATGADDEMEPRPYAILVNGQPETRYWNATNRPHFDASGRLTHIISAVRDITAEVRERRAAEARDLLMREVDHRARNALTVVQSVVRLTHGDSLESFKSTVLGRLDSLARAQTSLSERKWEGADLRAVLGAELEAIATDGRFELDGPAILLLPEHVQALSMAVHELATNARKYGGLSVQGGRVRVSWSLPEAFTLQLVWRETDGPPVREPERRGFGSQMIQQLVRQINGQLHTEWRPDGLMVTLQMALA